MLAIFILLQFIKIHLFLDSHLGVINWVSASISKLVPKLWYYGILGKYIRFIICSSHRSRFTNWSRIKYKSTISFSGKTKFICWSHKRKSALPFRGINLGMDIRFDMISSLLLVLFGLRQFCSALFVLHRSQSEVLREHRLESSELATLLDLHICFVRNPLTILGYWNLSACITKFCDSVGGST